MADTASSPDTTTTSEVAEAVEAMCVDAAMAKDHEAFGAVVGRHLDAIAPSIRWRLCLKGQDDELIEFADSGSDDGQDFDSAAASLEIQLLVGDDHLGTLEIVCPTSADLPVELRSGLVDAAGLLAISALAVRERTLGQQAIKEGRSAKRVLARRVQEMETLNRVLGSLGDLEAFIANLDLAARDLVLLRGIDLCDIVLVDGDGGLKVAAAAAAGRDVQPYVEVGQLLGDDSAHAEAVRAKDLVLFRDHTNELSEPQKALVAAGVSSHLAIPIYSGDSLLGVLSIATAGEGRAVSDEHIVLAQAVASQIATSLTNVRLIDELKEAVHVAEASSKAKSEFLANMSHELRTPMNGVLGMAGLLIESELNDEQQMFVNTIRTSGDALLAVISDILDFSKIEAGKLELDEHPFVLRSCVEDALDLVAMTAGTKGVDLMYEIQPDLPPAYLGDVTRVRQILINLLSNATKFTEEGHIAVTVAGEERADGRCQLQISVADTGIGIPEDRLDRLFQSFTQVDSSTTRKFGGTGLGLAISRELAVLMGGSMWVESVEGAGSTFHYTVAVTTADDARPDYVFVGLQPALQNRKVLLVDDNQVNRAIIQRQVRGWGMEAFTAESAADTVARFADSLNQFDIAILDYQMPGADGAALARELRQLGFKQPIVVLSSIGGMEPDTDRGVFDARLNKPVKPEMLCRITHNLIGTSATSPESDGGGSGLDGALGETHPLRILLAEDNIVNQKVATAILGKLGYKIDIVNNGREAVEAATSTGYDVILMDVQMPEMDGMEATTEILRQLPAEQVPYIIALTANAMQGDREMYLELGMHDYMAKPIQIPQLMAALKRVRIGVGADAITSM